MRTALFQAFILCIRAFFPADGAATSLRIFGETELGKATFDSTAILIAPIYVLLYNKGL
jgi:hypothetical protein